jgi:hypothetical protein
MSLKSEPTPLNCSPSVFGSLLLVRKAIVSNIGVALTNLRQVYALSRGSAPAIMELGVAILSSISSGFSEAFSLTSLSESFPVPE